jgi:hypothetical protein
LAVGEDGRAPVCCDGGELDGGCYAGCVGVDGDCLASSVRELLVWV